MSCYRNTTCSHLRQRAQTSQCGRGVGGVLRSLYTHMLPVIKSTGAKILSAPITKSVLQTAKKSAVDAGIRIAKDTLEGKKLSKSLGSNLNIAKEEISDAIKTSLNIRKGRKRPAVAKRRMGKKPRMIDLFNDEKVKID